MLLQRKFGAIPSQTHSPSLQGVQGIRMQSFIKAAFSFLPVPHDVLRAIPEASWDGHSSIRQAHESANASH